MSVKPFLDTNVLVYAFGPDPRRGRAQALLAAGGIISVQILNEFVNVARRKYQREWPEIGDALAIVRELLDPPLPLTNKIHLQAIEIARAHGLAFYDALVVAAAMQAGCALLYSEDMQDGRVIGDVTIRNPFAS